MVNGANIVTPVLCRAHLKTCSVIKTKIYNMYMTLDTCGNCCQSSLLSQHMHCTKIINLWKFELNRSSKLRDNNGRKNTLVTQSCVLSDAWFWDLTLTREVSRSNYYCVLWKITSFSKTTLLHKGAVYHDVLYRQQLPLIVNKK